MGAGKILIEESAPKNLCLFDFRIFGWNNDIKLAEN